MERIELRKLVLATGCAVALDEFLFVRDPALGDSEREKLATLTSKKAQQLSDDAGWLCLPTGGTSGEMRFARHDEHTVGAAVRGFCSHHGVATVNALDVLPAHHVSGLMARIRCAETGGQHVPWSWRQLEAGEWPVLPKNDAGWFLSLVPTQLHRLLVNAEAAARLRDFRAVFIGGGPLWPELAGMAAEARVPVAICYGMTETAAMIAAQTPEDFLHGDRSCGQPMIHAQVEILDENSGAILPRGETGLVRIRGGSVFHGYWPGANSEQMLVTEDLGRFDDRGRLIILGRRDAVIITGGKKVHPSEVEDALRASGEFDDVAVVGMPDREWGSAVVACFPQRARNLDRAKIEKALETLAPYKRPKRFVVVAPWPRNAQGKLNRQMLSEAALRQPL
ncbi:MAG: AMP-binding protein [Nibricoccus sp.]